MAFNIGGNIGSVEGDGATGQAYATKCLRTYTLTTTLTNVLVSGGGGILASDGTNIGYKTIPIVTPFMNGTYPRHLTIQNIRVSTNTPQINAGPTGIGYIILPTQPTGTWNLTTTPTQSNIQSMNMAFFYDSGATASWGTFSSDGAWRTRLISMNQMIGTTTNTPITNLYVALWLGTSAITPTNGTTIVIQVDVSFE
jgi:hypothetical protein